MRTTLNNHVLSSGLSTTQRFNGRVAIFSETRVISGALPRMSLLLKTPGTLQLPGVDLGLLTTDDGDDVG